MSRLVPAAAILLLLSSPAMAQLGALQAAAPTPAPAAIPAAAPGQAPAGSVGGMGDINLYPKRVVLSDRERTASIGLYNRAALTGDYDITLTELVMTPDGRLLDPAIVTDPALLARLRSALPMLKWSPHRVTLPVNEAQMVRVMARIPPDLPPGEYRAHFNAIAIPPRRSTKSRWSRRLASQRESACALSHASASRFPSSSGWGRPR